MPSLIANPNSAFLQSKELYLQAVGSTGADESSEGVHLRWDFTNDFSDQFPTASQSINVYKAAYTSYHHAEIDFAAQPDNIVTYGNQRLWVYTPNVPLPNDPAHRTTVVIRFMNVQFYDTLVEQLGAGFTPRSLLNNYTDVFKIWSPDKLFFEFGFEFQNPDEGVVQIEAISIHADQTPGKLFLSCRGEMVDSDQSPTEGVPSGFISKRVEYMEYIRCQHVEKTSIEKFYLATYADTLQGDYNWDLIDKAFLHPDGNQRILDTPKWMKYNRYNDGGTPNYVPLANMQAYQDRWLNQGLQSAVGDFLSGNLANSEEVISNDDLENPEPAEMTYSDMFRIAAADYHIARMLGLGFIDNEAKEGVYIYAIEYKGKHFSLSLPTSASDSRYPQAPELELGYGIVLSSGECNASVDEDGYAHFETARYINLKREVFQYEQAVPAPFSSDEPYLFTTAAIQFGVRHKRSNSTMPNYQELQLLAQLQDDSYADQGGGGEEIAVLDSGEFTAPVYIHRTAEEAFHHYGIYSINWFSRTEENYLKSLSNLVSSDETVFSERCGIVTPVTDASAQVIFKEIPPILTTGTEQAMLNADGSNLVVRVQYKWRPPADWGIGGNLQFETPDTVEFYFREFPAEIIHGTISNVMDQGCGICTVSIGSDVLSDRFVGSVLVADEMPYVVKEINGTDVVIKCIPNNGIINPSNTAAAHISTDYVSPEPGSPFVLTENLQSPDSWTKLETEVPLTPANTDGITQTVSISQLPPTEGAGTTNSGVYDITFSGVDEDNSSIGGTVLINGTTYSVMDSYYDESGQLHVIINDHNYDPEDDQNYTPLEINQEATYVPGTRIYLDESSGLDYATVYPSGQDVTKVTYLGLRAVNSVSGCGSAVTPPLAMVAAGYQAPVVPSLSPESEYATRPDFYGKSSYTFRASFTEEPYAVVFYRADGKSILEQLYTAQRLAEILANYTQAQITEALQSLIDNGTVSSVPPPDNLGEHSDAVSAIQSQISSGFIPLTRQPILYDKITGTVASPKPASSTNAFPMVVKAEGDLLFTDFTLDGANSSVVFYCAVGMNNRLEMSEASNVIGPIRLVNSFPPKPVTITSVISSLPNFTLDQGVSVRFTVNPHVSSEQISQYQIYRANNHADALSIHSMPLVKTIDGQAAIIDDFSDSDYPPYGEPLFYRIVALREVVGENGATEFSPSFPSEVALASVIDTLHPETPVLTYDANEVTNSEGVLESLENVVLSWEKTVHNGTYDLYYLDVFSNWTRIYQISSNDTVLSINLGDTTLGNSSLVKLGSNNEEVFHRFKVVAINSSGMVCLDERRLII